MRLSRSTSSPGDFNKVGHYNHIIMIIMLNTNSFSPQGSILTFKNQDELVQEVKAILIMLGISAGIIIKGASASKTCVEVLMMMIMRMRMRMMMNPS